MMSNTGRTSETNKSMSDNIEPVAVVPPKRRKILVNYKLCIICQTSNSSHLSEGTEHGIAKSRKLVTSDDYSKITPSQRLQMPLHLLTLNLRITQNGIKHAMLHSQVK